MIAPGVGATFYGSLPHDLDAHAAVIGACDLVTLHTAADASDALSAQRVRALGCQRVWLAIPANYLSKLDAQHGRAAACAEAVRCAQVAVSAGAEVFEFNGEGSPDGAAPGDWTSAPGDTAERDRLASLATDLIAAARGALAGRCAIGWTSHDMPGFRLPWRAILDGVDLHSPQHYPAESGRTVAQRELERRVASSHDRWDALATQSLVPADAIPYAPRWSPYFQGWGHDVGALVWALCEASTARLWACPGSWSSQAEEALRLARKLRATHGYGAGAIGRFQAAAGLPDDGVVGPRTLDALRRIV